MALNIPPAVNYQSPLVAVPSVSGNPPNEGQKLIACEIDWATMGGANNCVSINLQNNATLSFRQITALSVDNSTCGSDVRFIFPDTTETVTIPAYSPKVIVPVFTNQTQFFVQAIGEQPEDVTKFSILNFVPPPIAVPVSLEQNIASVANIPVTSSGNQQIIASSISGTIEAMTINYYGSTASGAASVAWALRDGSSTPVIMTQGINAFQSGANQGTVVQLSNLQLRFQNGINFVFVVTGTPAAGSVFMVNLYYRTP